MARPLWELVPEPEDVLAMTPEEVGGLILEHLLSMDRSEGGSHNRHNYSLHYTVQGYPRQFHERLLRAIMEGWVWLESEGLIAPEPGKTGDWVFVTRRGQALKTRADVASYQSSRLLPRRLLHPAIASKVWVPFLRGDYDVAVFQAFKEVELAVRAGGEYGATDFGVALMRAAFAAGKGPLSDHSLPIPEQEAQCHLFAGAIGYCKNPQSHRNVGIDDKAEAVELLLFASYLLRLVDRAVSARHGDGGG